MDEHEVKRTIMWLCRKCYEGIRETPQEKYPSRKKYNIWECGNKQKNGACGFCSQWNVLTMYEMENLEMKEERARRQAARDYSYGRRKDTRARYRERWSDT